MQREEPSSPEKSSGMLDGVIVLDLTSSVAGPYGAMLLGDFGASIVKVERPGGDDARTWGPPFLAGESLWFLSVNRNKKSICLDTASPAGRRLLDDLFDRADVVITNQLKGTQDKLGIDAETVRARRPGLIHVSVTGFGLTGPNSDLACYDLIAEGYSGVMDLTGAPDSPPQKIGTPAADLLAGSDAALAVAAALYRKARTGEGATIDVSLTESMIRFLTPRIVPYLGSGEVPRRSGGADSVIAVYQVFDTADRPLTLALGNDTIWQRFWTAVGEPADLAGDMATNSERRSNRARIVEIIQQILLTRGRDDWLTRFRLARVPAGPINRVDEVVRDRHFRDRDMFFQIERDGESLPQVGLGIRIDGTVPACKVAPPRCGEHSREIVSAIVGYGEDQIAALERAGAIEQFEQIPVAGIKEGETSV